MHSFIFSRAALVAAVTFVASFSNQALAQNYYTGGHGDIGVGYTPGESTFEPHWHLGSGAIVNGSAISGDREYAPHEAIAWTTATFDAPSGSDTWLGVASGTTVFRMGSSSFQPNIGWATEEAGFETDWFNGTINISLTDWSSSNPGDFALVASGNALFSTYGASGNTWAFDVEVGHAHATWYFSQPGYYELSFTWTGLYTGAGSPPEGIAITATNTFGIQVGAIPEPSSFAVLASLAVLGMTSCLRRRRI
ncbi:MAG: PEP-CTERM sorting domain-containing protein [Rariglobus sp.]